MDDRSSPIERCNDLDEIAVDRFFLQNSQWGKTGVSDFEQCVEQPGPDLFPVGWHFRWPEGAADQVRGYPFLGFGQDPWRRTSTLPELPRRAGEAGRIGVTHEIDSTVTGKYNLAFDVWITSEPGVTSPPEANIRREVMIWLDYSENPLPSAWLLETVTIDGEAYQFYKGANEPTGSYVRDYLAFPEDGAASQRDDEHRLLHPLPGRERTRVTRGVRA